MLANVVVYNKVLKCAQSCKTHDQVYVVMNWSKRLVNRARLTRFEYEKVLYILDDLLADKKITSFPRDRD